MEEMLHVHILLAADVISGLKTKDKKKVEKANKTWHKNADDIAKFLSKINASGNYDDMKKMMHKHLALTTQEAVSRFKRKWEDDVKSADQALDQSLEMADGISDGIAQQFLLNPKKS